MKNLDVIIVGAGAAGLMCAIESAKRGRKTLVLEKANKPGKKILMSGGGRCNFTNYYIEPEKYLSHNPHFCKSALTRYTQWDFIRLVELHGIAYYEKTLGQLFCENKASDIVEMLLKLCARFDAEIKLSQTITSIKKNNGSFIVMTESDVYHCQSLVIASGGVSIPTMGASPFGYHIASQFGHHILPTRAGLVPFTLHDYDKQKYESLAGISVNCKVECNQQIFEEMLLFTHRGLSGPAMLQISSYWQSGDTLNIKLLPEINWSSYLIEAQKSSPEQHLKTLLSMHFAKRLLSVFFDEAVINKPLKQFNHLELSSIINCLQQWNIKPNNTEGYRTAEITLGGVDCDEVSSKTFESHKESGLYFIGEVLDVSGWLGGYNFQWAWSSGWAAGQVV